VAISETVGEEGEVTRLPGLIELGAREGVLVITVEALISSLQEHEIALVSDVSAAQRFAR
jgi:3,4-dihydroxy 2-butanone 4-phosphate synthase/GTP cyclohydrolase II